MIGVQTGHAGDRQDRLLGDLRRVPDPRVRSDPDGGDRPGRSPPLRFARGRVDRRGRPIPDGAGGPGGAARDPRLHRAVPGRRDTRPSGSSPACPISPGSPTSGPRREATPTLYAADEEFPVGGSKTLREGSDVALVGAGITLHESLRAADRLAADGVSARVLDCYSVKPIDANALRAAADDIGLLVVVEDHRIEGGLGDAVLDALAGTGDLTGRVVKLAVTDLPGSGIARRAPCVGGDRRGRHRRSGTSGARPRLRDPSPD